MEGGGGGEGKGLAGVLGTPLLGARVKNPRPEKEGKERIMAFMDSQRFFFAIRDLANEIHKVLKGHKPGQESQFTSGKTVRKWRCYTNCCSFVGYGLLY